MAKRLGIMGGTFNPVHNGHIYVANISLRELKLDEVRFIPTGDSPHKTNVGVSGRQRLEMVQLAVKDCERFTASDIEILRGGRSYTCDTLKQIKSQEKDTELFFLMGSDMITTFTTWRNPENIVRLCSLVAIPRPGDDVEHIRRVCDYLRMEYSADVYMLSEIGPQISSTDIRQRVQSGCDIGELVPKDVASYIYEHELYRTQETGNDI